MLRLLLMILACLVAIGAVMASVTPGRHRVAPAAVEPAVRIEAEPSRSPDTAAADGDEDARPTASELAPDAGGSSSSSSSSSQAAPAAHAMPGPALRPSPQYPDTVAPGATATPTPETGPAPEVASEAGQRRVTASRVNLRGGPGTTHGVVGALDQGALVTPLAPEADGWQQVRSADGLEGYLATQFLSAPLP